jgi:uncharacterized glyoxalase superfamily protein PhnB
MTIKRVVPDIKSNDFDGSRKFYAEFLGFDVAMDMDFVMTFASPSNPTAQISIIKNEETELQPAISIEVDDVEKTYVRAQELGLKIVYPLSTEPWGVKRFFVIDPNGVVINVLSHC